MVIIEMENGDEIKLIMAHDVAPNTVKNFLYLADSGFYEGLEFHRVIKDFMIQGGCPNGDGTGGPGYCIKGEFTMNGFYNPLQHRRGTISMARTMRPDSAGSQFFIMHKDAFHLDGQYAAFGRVYEGMDVVDKIAAVETDQNNHPLEPVRIKRIRLENEKVTEPEKC
jgi:peptidyl-prolyl cis-trans isomerase B (cyclophilin B)